jgi:hypothetical protein
MASELDSSCSFDDALSLCAYALPQHFRRLWIFAVDESSSSGSRHEYSIAIDKQFYDPLRITCSICFVGQGDESPTVTHADIVFDIMGSAEFKFHARAVLAEREVLSPEETRVVKFETLTTIDGRTTVKPVPVSSVPPPSIVIFHRHQPPDINLWNTEVIATTTVANGVRSQQTAIDDPITQGPSSEKLNDFGWG